MKNNSVLSFQDDKSKSTKDAQKFSHKINCGKLKEKEIFVDFSGGKITSDGGIILIAELDKKLKITTKFAK